jgi:hypothetical protein
MNVILVRGVHIREATSSSLVAPTFSIPWSVDQGFFVPPTWFSLEVKRITDHTVQGNLLSVFWALAKPTLTSLAIRKLTSHSATAVPALL